MKQSEKMELLDKWYYAKAKLDTVKESEMELRKLVVAEFFDPNDHEGTKRFDLPDGYKLKVAKKQNYKLKNDSGELDKALENVSEDLAALLVKWTPSLALANYKTLSVELQKEIFSGCLEITDAAPTLEIENPKAKS